MLLSYHYTTQCHNPEECDLNLYHHENLKVLQCDTCLCGLGPAVSAFRQVSVGLPLYCRGGGRGSGKEEGLHKPIRGAVACSCCAEQQIKEVECVNDVFVIHPQSF
jgi:hypothetical protein